MPTELAQFVDINGQPQWLTVRGDDSANPVLFIVSSPGTALSRMTEFFAPWQKDFTLVQWDQPNAGATLAKSTAPVILSIERIIQDGIAVAEFICRSLHVRKIAVLGISRGTIIALNLVKRRPELFSSYVGTGQIVNWAHQDFLSYETLLDDARSTGNDHVLTELESLGPPPYASTAEDAIKSKYAGALTAAEKRALEALDPSVMFDIWPAASTEAIAAYDALRAEIVEFDAHRLGMDFAVPMFFLQGELDVFTVASAVWRYAEEIQAPQKEFDLIDGGGHSVFLMRDAFLAALNFHVRAAALDGQRSMNKFNTADAGEKAVR
jgi:pimeloyl-ACP methyl ester carboxylesterase